MTTDAVSLLWAVLLAVAGCTERHQLLVVVFTGVICVKDLMALLAIKAMFATRILEIGKLAQVALSTLCRLQRCWCDTVQGRVDLRQLTHGSKNRPWLGKPSQGSNDQYDKNRFNVRHFFSFIYLAGQLFRS